MTILQQDKQISTEDNTQRGPFWSQLILPQNLWAGWQKVRTNHGGAGGDGISVDQFARAAPARIDRLAADLAAGRYVPGPFRRVAIPKKHGGERVLAIPCVIDRIVQTTVASLIGPLIDGQFHRASYAYRPGRGVTQAVQAVLRYRREGYRWAAEGDVEHCFEDIAHEPLLDRLDAVVRDPRLTDLVALWLGCYAPDGVGIPQGSPLSPLLCNLHLDVVDAAMDGSGVRLVRYADDFVILTKSENRASAALEQMAVRLRQRGLSLNPEKSRIVAADHALRFLGHVFIRSMAFKEVAADDDLPAPPDAPPEEVLAQWQQLTQNADAPEAADVDPRPSRRRTLYLMEPGAMLSGKHHSFVALGPEEVDAHGKGRRQGRAIEHANRIDRIEVGPHAAADWDAVRLAAAHDIPLAIVDGWGATTGWLVAPGDLRGRRILAQARFLADPAQQQSLAAAIVRGRIYNQQRLLNRLNRKNGDPALVQGVAAIKRLRERLPRLGTVDVVRGHEGNAARLYWPLYAKALPQKFAFDWKAWHRDRRPPPDAVNACLGYLAALLERDVRVAVERAGLHPGMGALHVARDGNDALVYDLMEGFRAALPEAILTTMIARSQLRPDMFVLIDEQEPSGGIVRKCRIELAGRRALIQAWESKMARPIESRRTSQKVSWRALLEEEARAMADLFTGAADSFQPYLIDI